MLLYTVFKKKSFFNNRKVFLNSTGIETPVRFGNIEKNFTADDCIILKANTVFLLLINLFGFLWYQPIRFGTPCILRVPCNAHNSQVLIRVNFVSVLPT